MPGQEATGDRAHTGTRITRITRITRAGNVRYEHDEADRITLRQKTRLSPNPDTWRYTWDTEDRPHPSALPRPVPRPRNRPPLQLLRHYDPETARYLTPDPLGLAPADNPTTYVHNPHSWIDPLGLAPCESFPVYRTPKAKDAEFELQHGPNPANHQPGVDIGGGLPSDGLIHFGERSVAAEFYSWERMMQ